MICPSRFMAASKVLGEETVNDADASSNVGRSGDNSRQKEP